MPPRIAEAREEVSRKVGFPITQEMLLEEMNKYKDTTEFYISGLSRLENGHHDPRVSETIVPVIKALRKWDRTVTFEDIWEY